MFSSLRAANASWILRRASRYLTIASAVSSEAATTSRSISSRFGRAATSPLPATVTPSMFSVATRPEFGPKNWACAGRTGAVTPPIRASTPTASLSLLMRLHLLPGPPRIGRDLPIGDRQQEVVGQEQVAADGPEVGAAE